IAAGDRQVVREDETDSRCRRVGVDLVREDAEAVRGDDALVGGADARVFLDLEAGAVGAVGRLPDLARLEAAADEAERLGAVGGIVRTDIGVDRAGRDIGKGLLALRPVLRLPPEIGDGEVEPEAGIVAGNGERLAEIARRLVIVPGAVRDAAGFAERGIGAARRVVALLDRAGEFARLVDEVARDEGEFAEAGLLEARREVGPGHHPAGGGAGEGGERAEVALQEAPAGLVVEGEGAAIAVREAGGLAAFDVGALDRVVVEAGIVGVGREQDAALLRRALAGGVFLRGSGACSEQRARRDGRRQRRRARLDGERISRASQSSADQKKQAGKRVASRTNGVTHGASAGGSPPGGDLQLPATLWTDYGGVKTSGGVL